MTQPPPPGGYTPRWPGERPFSGHGAPPYGSPAQGPGQYPAPEKKKAGCFKTVLIALGILVVFILVIGVIATVQGDTEDATAAKTEATVDPSHKESSEPLQDEPQEQDEGDTVTEGGHDAAAGETAEEEAADLTFRGKQDNDLVTVPGEILSSNKANYRAAPLRPFTTLGINVLCTTVAIGNPGGGEVDFSYFEWELQNPNGVIVTPTVFDGGRPTLDGRGTLAPSGVAQGDVCFEGDPAALPGEYIVLRDSSTFFTTKRMAWVNYL